MSLIEQLRQQMAASNAKFKASENNLFGQIKPLPKFEMPTFEMPAMEMPTMQMPAIQMPEFPSFPDTNLNGEASFSLEETVVRMSKSDSSGVESSEYTVTKNGDSVTYSTKTVYKKSQSSTL